MFDVPTVAKALAEVVREHVGAAFRSLQERMAAIEQRLADLPKPKDGEDGKSVTVDDVRPLIDQQVQDAVAHIPKPRDGEDGKSVRIEEVLPELRGQVEAYLKEIPVPQDGKSVTVDEVVQALLPALQTTLDAALAKWALDFERRAQETLQRACDRIPKPKDGDPGRDALAVTDFGAEVEDDGRTIVLTLGAGEQRKQARLQFPVVIHRGVYVEGRGYARGDSVTWAGSTWIAQKDGPEGKPETSRDWLLSVKRGAPGKQGEVKVVREPATVTVGG
jgi:hypothetical protein